MAEIEEKPKCWYCDNEATRLLKNGVYLCDNLSECWLEEISTQTAEWFEED